MINNQKQKNKRQKNQILQVKKIDRAPFPTQGTVKLGFSNSSHAYDINQHNPLTAPLLHQATKKFIFGNLRSKLLHGFEF